MCAMDHVQLHGVSGSALPMNYKFLLQVIAIEVVFPSMNYASVSMNDVEVQ
jgi:hypothetical protein